MFRSLPFVAVLIALCTVFVSVQADALMDELVRKYTDNTKRSLPQTGSCTARNLVVRKEWGNLSRTQRLDYIRAVKCLASRPSKFDRTKAPGVRSRYDDFEAAHIIQTPFTHGTGSFFTWHRHLLYLYETALREECGYNGFQPYWDWAKYADRPIKANPLYDGSDTSMSGNGRYIPNRSGTYQPLPIPIENPPALYCPPGTGGGPVFEGPFVNWELHLGPGVPLNNTVNGYPVNPNPRPDGLGYNPRRLLRDFNNTLLQDYNTYPAITSMLTNMTDIASFQTYFFVNPHTSAHLFISGYDNDLWTSPGDPLFWFHHAQVDRMYSIWQSFDFAVREKALDGTLTLLNIPPSRNATLDDWMKYEFSPDVQIKSAMSPTKGKYCYIYE